jgi:hypothetical protein
MRVRCNACRIEKPVPPDTIAQLIDPTTSCPRRLVCSTCRAPYHVLPGGPIDFPARGQCGSCGRAIEAERIEALPTATQCLTCRRISEARPAELIGKPCPACGCPLAKVETVATNELGNLVTYVTVHCPAMPAGYCRWWHDRAKPPPRAEVRDRNATG